MWGMRTRKNQRAMATTVSGIYSIFNIPKPKGREGENLDETDLGEEGGR